MRAALEAAARAAQGAVPQAEPVTLEGRCQTCGSEVSEGDADEVAEFLAAPLPSSGVDEDDCWHEANCRCIRAGNVDEDKLAEVIGSLDWGYVVDGPSVREIARAVAEWLKGQGQ